MLTALEQLAVESSYLPVIRYPRHSLELRPKSARDCPSQPSARLSHSHSHSRRAHAPETHFSVLGCGPVRRSSARARVAEGRPTQEVGRPDKARPREVLPAVARLPWARAWRMGATCLERAPGRSPSAGTKVWAVAGKALVTKTEQGADGFMVG